MEDWQKKETLAQAYERKKRKSEERNQETSHLYGHSILRLALILILFLVLILLVRLVVCLRTLCGRRRGLFSGHGGGWPDVGLSRRHVLLCSFGSEDIEEVCFKNRMWVLGKVKRKKSLGWTR
jgi:hypothetical protein